VLNTRQGALAHSNGNPPTEERSLMASSSKRHQTQAKRAREQALKERRERKQERRAARRTKPTPDEDGADTGTSENA
jgi:hypothetical protein